MCKIEILFSEVCNLYGDIGNVTLLKKIFSPEDFVFTSLLDEPYFVKHDVDFIYMGPSIFKTQLQVIEKLKPYKERIKELIDKGTIFLFTGNAMEILGKNIIDNNGNSHDSLGIFDITSKRHPNSRYNSLILGEFDNLKIVGYISQDSTCTISNNQFIKVLKSKDNWTSEGIKVNNFFGTNLLGPILVLNPYFTKYILNLMNAKKEIPFLEEMIEAYNQRLMEYEKEGIHY